jgi:hypothetical protein
MEDRQWRWCFNIAECIKHHHFNPTRLSKSSKRGSEDSGSNPSSTRSYSSFSDVQEEVVNARIWEGIHFRFADEAARKQGRHVAQWAFGHFLRPLDD